MPAEHHQLQQRLAGAECQRVAPSSGVTRADDAQDREEVGSLGILNSLTLAVSRRPPNTIAQHSGCPFGFRYQTKRGTLKTSPLLALGFKYIPAD